MTITQYQFFYDGQQRRYLEQLVRAFSGFSYQTGMRAGQPPQTVLVPCHLAQSNRMMANIRQNLSENTLNAVPMITVFQTGLRGRKADLQNPTFVDRLQVFEREVLAGQSYGARPGNTYSVDRLMPLPFEMDVQVDIWTSNLDQKYQLIEQIMPVIYPQFEIQNSDNALDWSAVTVCFTDDDITFSSRSVPIGQSEEIDIATIRLRIPFWLTPPAMIRQLTRIEQVVANVNQATVDVYDGTISGGTIAQTVVTPGDQAIAVDGNVVTLVGSQTTNAPSEGYSSWSALFQSYGQFRSGQTELRLMLTDDIEGPYVAGTLQPGATPNSLLWTIDPTTLPANTLPAVHAVIDPSRSGPGIGLPPPADGTRYLLVNDIGPCVAWGPLTAVSNDIIMYNGTLGQWTISFDSRATTQIQYVLNLHTNRQLRWTGREWLIAIDNLYHPGYWRLAL